MASDNPLVAIWVTLTMTYPGGGTNIQHETYAYQSKREYFYGEWAFSLGGGGIISTQWVIFTGTYTGSDGTVYTSGQEDGVSGTAALGIFNSVSNQFIVVVQDNVGYDFYYQFPLGDDRRMLGLGTIEPVGTVPTSLPDPSSGSRLLFKSELSTPKALQRPEVTKLRELEPKLNAYINRH